jgi:hypothetical protein
MPRRNDIAKILIIGSIALAMVVSSWLLFPSPARACSLSFESVHVSSNFRVIVSHGSTPIPGIQVEVYDEGERRDSHTEQKPILTVITSQNGAAEIKNLDKGTYLVVTKGPGGGSGVYAVIGDRPEKSTSEISLEWPFSLNQTLKARTFSGNLVSNDPWKPFENVQVLLWAPGLEKPLAVADTGPQGRFHFDVTQPGIYVLRVLGSQRDVSPDGQIEGDLSVELDPSAPDASPSLFLRFSMTTCGIKYSNCPASDTAIVTASRRIKVMHRPGMAEYPEVKNAKYKLLDARGALLVEGATNQRGIAELPPDVQGKVTLIVGSSGLTTFQQSLELLSPDESAPGLVVTMTVLGDYSESCSTVRLEKNATPQ